MTLQSACSASGGKPYTQTFDYNSQVRCDGSGSNFYCEYNGTRRNCD